ncbi:MAG: GTP-binding protein [Candidatus Methanoperedens sp.]|nr:GTP-binding protein [Candidatus Methanoperedens sp.]
MIGTGIPKLDGFLGGGVPKGKSLVYYIQPGVEGEIFGMQTIYTALKYGETGVFIASSTNPDNIRDQFRQFGWDIQLFKDNLFFVDAYNSLIGAPSSEKYVVLNPSNIRDLDKIIVDAMRELPPSIITFGSLSTMMDLCGEKETIEAIRNWNRCATHYNHATVYNFTAWPYSQEALDLIKKDLFNAVIAIGGIADRVIFGQYFWVLKSDWIKETRKSMLKSDWAKEIKRSMLFKVLRPGGVKLFIPKILVIGPSHAGKSTFVHALANQAVSIDWLGTTVALDHGHVDYNGFNADIFGTPDQERFDPVIKLLSGEAMGVFLVVDSTNPENIIRVKQMLGIIKSYGLPYIVIANKQDLAGAMNPEEIRKELDLSEDISIIPAVAKDKIGVFEAFEVLIDKITRGI